MRAVKLYISIFMILIYSHTLYAKNIEMKTIAFAQDDMSNDFRKAQVMEGLTEAQEYPNIRYIYSSAKGQTSLLIANIDRYIKSGVDVIIVGTNDKNNLNRVIERAYDKGIKIVILDRGVTTNKYHTFLHSNNIEIGRIGAKYISKRLHNRGVVLLFEGLPKADVTEFRTKGFMEEISKHKDIKVIKRVGNYLRRDAIIEMEKLIKQNIKIDAIFAHSDSMLSGVRSVLKRYKIDPSQIITVGCDYTKEAKIAIQNKQQSASILFPLGTTQAVEIAIKLLENKNVSKDILISVALVTDENLDLIEPIF